MVLYTHFTLVTKICKNYFFCSYSLKNKGGIVSQLPSLPQLAVVSEKQTLFATHPGTLWRSAEFNQRGPAKMVPIGPRSW
ncbi:hypothetical protein XELAEV_18000385mg [Xenopus laevis]|uniref:Uncharacterized protein n=1 Tax=Xenopus laevis TaxID=8355 RepID=A0A974GYK3_XENLA|nr:hypothetical protein XELAEV_18000385mg [Xenopus laevis]